MFKKIAVFLFVLILYFVLWQMIKPKSSENFSQKIKEGDMKLTSVFVHGEKIPSIYTCDGEDFSPELRIADVPEGTKSLALIADDPDAPVGLFVHWVVYNIPVSAKAFSSKTMPEGAVEGMTNFGRVGYGGPCPPNGSHRYFFKMYALDKTMDLAPGATKLQLERAMDGHILEKAELMGVYSRN